MEKASYYIEYSKVALRQYAKFDARRRYLLVDAVADEAVRRVLDVGCGAEKEIFQTERFLRRALAGNKLRIKSYLPDTNRATPSYLIEKI